LILTEQGVAASLRERIVARLRNSEPGSEPEFPYAASFTPGQIAELRQFLPERLARAAVLVPLVERPDGLNVLLTLRASHLKNHAGQVSFPGGRIEENDASPWEAALREAREEIGLEPGAVEIVARLSGVATAASAFTITPFVGFVETAPRLVPNPGEVVRVLEVPLSELLDATLYREERWDAFHPDMAVFFFELADETIWGATARILTDLLTRLVTPAA